MILETYDKELHDKTLRSEGYETGKAEGFSSERENGILQLLSTLQELNISRQDAHIKLKEKYSLSKEEAEKYLDKYWKGLYLSSFLNHNMDTIAIPFVYLSADGFCNAYDIAYGTVLIFYPHVHNTPVIWLSVKFCMDFYPPPAEFFPDIPWENDVCSSSVRNAVNYPLIFISFPVHRNALFPLIIAP